MSIIKNFNGQFSMVRDAEVELHPFSTKNGLAVRAVIADKFDHIYQPYSSVAESVAHGDLEKVQDQLNGGSFFFNHGNDEGLAPSLVSYRNRNYRGFVHTDDSIANLIEHIGYTTDFDRAQYHNSSSRHLRLQKVQSNVEMNIAQYHSGGEMNSELSFAWDPFQAHIRAVYRLVRLICANGMVGLSSMVNCKIPVINQWQEHMEIANKQIQNRITNIVEHRMSSMSITRASVRDCQRVTDIAHARMDSPMNVAKQTALSHLRNVALVSDPELHLKNHYPSAVFTDRRLSDQKASHLTEFTVWNMLTEMATHTYETSQSSNLALYKHANELLIDRGDARFKMIDNTTNRTMSESTVKFDDIDAAFAGDLIEA